MNAGTKELRHEELQIKLFTEQPTDSRGTSYRFQTNRFGQLNYIARRCKEKGIAYTLEGKFIRIFAVNKLPYLNDIIKESIAHDLKRDAVMRSKTLTVMELQTLLAVLIKDEDGVITAHLTEKHMENFIFYVYRKEVPKPLHYEIYSSKRELVNKLETLNIVV